MRRRIGYGTVSYLALLASAFSSFSGTSAQAGDLTVSAATTNPISTGAGDGAGPGNILVNGTGSVVVTSPTAVTINTSNTFTNQGSVATSIQSNGSAVVVDLGQTSPNSLSTTITNSNVITAVGLGSSNQADTTSLNNIGIDVRGRGTMTGNIINDATGQVAVGTNGAYGIAVRGNMVGNLTNAGTINALGPNSYGIMTTGRITGTVTTAGTIAAGGNGATGVYLGGGITGTYVHSGSILAGSGPQVALAPNGIDLTTTDPIPAFSGLWVGGDITQGILLQGNQHTAQQEAADPTIVQNQTIADSAINFIGSGSAIYIAPGGPNPNPSSFTIGTRTDNTNYSIVSQGNLTAAGAISGLSASGITIQGLTVGSAIYKAQLAGGILIDGGNITVSSVDATSTALKVGNYGVLPLFDNRGDIFATVTDSTADSVTGALGTKGGNAYGIFVDTQGTLNTFNNTGNMTATGGGTNGSGYGVVDRSGTLRTITNSGSITATIPTGGAGKTIAIDLSANTLGASITNTGVITGDTLLGGGNSSFSTSGAGAAAGTLNGLVTGNVTFQAGAAQSGNNTVSLNTATITGNVALGNGNHVVTLVNNSAIKGNLSSGATGTTQLTVDHSKVSVAAQAPLHTSTATFTTGAALTFNLPSIAPTAPIMTSTGTMSFAAGSTITAAYTGILSGVQNYTLIKSANLQFGAPVSQIATVPGSFLNATQIGLAATDPNSLVLTVRPKTAAELHLGANQTALFSVYGPILNADSDVATAVSAMSSEADLKKSLNQLLPDTSGATQQVALNSQDMAAGLIRRRLVGVAKNGLPDHALGDVSSFWGQAIGDVSDQSAHGAEQQGFTAWGLGIALGADTPVGDHSDIGIGFESAWHSADNNTAHLSATQYNSNLIYLYGRTDIGSLYAEAIGGGGFNNYNQTRRVNISTLSRKVTGKWNGYQYGGSLEIGDNIRSGLYDIAPFLRASYLKMHEDAYTEADGGNGINLQIGPKNPEATIRGTTGFVATRDFPIYYDSYAEAEFRANYTREFTHGVSTLTAAFASGGPSFVNMSDPRAPNRFTVGAGISHKDSYSSVSLDYDAEFASGYLAHIIAVTARFRF